MWVVFRVATQRLAVDAHHVHELLQLPPVTPIPGGRSVLNFRGEVIPVVDLRTILSLPTVESETEEIVSVLDQRQADHQFWLDTLEESVREGTKFTLALDHTQCAFGRWYAKFKAPSMALESHMPRFDEPHRELHGLAAKLMEMVGRGEKEQAIETLQYKRATTLAHLNDLFNEAKRLMRESNRELCVVVMVDNVKLALKVDHVEAVGPLDQVAPLPDTSPSPLLRRSGRLGKQNELVIVLELEALLADLRGGALPMEFAL